MNCFSYERKGVSNVHCTKQQGTLSSSRLRPTVGKIVESPLKTTLGLATKSSTQLKESTQPTAHGTHQRTYLDESYKCPAARVPVIATAVVLLLSFPCLLVSLDEIRHEAA